MIRGLASLRRVSGVFSRPDGIDDLAGLSLWPIARMALLLALLLAWLSLAPAWALDPQPAVPQLDPTAAAVQLVRSAQQAHPDGAVGALLALVGQAVPLVAYLLGKRQGERSPRPPPSSPAI